MESPETSGSRQDCGGYYCKSLQNTRNCLRSDAQVARSKRVKLHNVQNISPQDSSTVVLVNEATASNTLTGTLSNKKNKALSGVEVSPLYIRTMP